MFNQWSLDNPLYLSVYILKLLGNISYVTTLANEHLSLLPSGNCTVKERQSLCECQDFITCTTSRCQSLSLLVVFVGGNTLTPRMFGSRLIQYGN